MLRVRLLGQLAVERDGEPVPVSGPPARLLAFLALTAGPHERGAVAARFWPDSPEPVARANLRTTLWSLRKVTGDGAIRATRTGLALSREHCWVDFLAVGEALEGGDPAAAISLCRGELLADLDEEWVVPARQELIARQVAALDELVTRASHGEDHAAAVRWSRMRCALTPLDEPAHCTLLRALVAAGDRAGAVTAGREFVRTLRDRLGVAPTAATRAVIAEVAGPPVHGPAASTRERPPMFGRRAELTLLTDAWAAARAGRGRVVVVTGEGGIGKTRLAAELARRADNAGARVAVGAGIDIGGDAPLAVWHELARELVARVPAPPAELRWPLELGRLTPDLPAALGRRGRPPPVAAPELERLRIFDAVLRLVEWAAATRPLLLVAEDLHRADGASLALCAHIGRRLEALPVLFVLTRRDRPVRPDADALLADLIGRGVDVIDVELGPMSADELMAVARSLATLDERELAGVVAAADGNPLLAVESVRALTAGGSAPPANLRAAVRAATRGLRPGPRELVEALAAAGRELSPAEIDALGLPARSAAEAAALDCGLIHRVRGGLTFRHALLAEAARVDLSDPARRHEQVALAVESAAGPTDAHRVAAEVARHLHAAGRDDLAAARWELAAAHARSLGAPAEAADFLAAAIACRPDAPGPRLELAEVYGWLGRPDDFEAEWRRALELPLTEAVRAWARRGLVLRTVVCNPSGSLAAYRIAWELTNADTPADLMTAMRIGLAWGEASVGDPARAVELLDAVTETVAEPDPGTVAEIGNIRLMTLTRLGRFSECEATALTVGPQAVRAERPDLAYAAWLHTSCALSAAGDVDGALRCAERAVEATRGIPVLELQGHAARAYVLARQDRHAEAMEAAAVQLDMATRMDSAQMLATARHDAGVVLLAAGMAAQAADLLAEALTVGGSFNRPAARLARAEALARLAAVDEATAELRRAALEPVRPGDQPWSLVPRLARVQGLIASAAGDSVGAAARFEEALAGWRRLVRPAAAEEMFANFVDLGRPPIAGLIEPAREIERLEAELEQIASGLEV